MGRTPCCDSMGLRRGPWTPEEDTILISYINQNGHGNWRALPQRAGLLRCGKSCRLRWMNYLRPDIKRGNFTREEEEAIFKLHQELGNRWSVIAARLPGRTDNEIKNVWHTHLKKRLITTNKQSRPKPEPVSENQQVGENSRPSSLVHSTSEISSLTTGGDAYFNHLPEADGGFWSEVFSGDDSSATSDFSAGNSGFSGLGSDVNMEGGMEFWYNMLDGADQLLTTELLEF